mgnify:CR=1 FL=1
MFTGCKKSLENIIARKDQFLLILYISFNTYIVPLEIFKTKIQATKKAHFRALICIIIYFKDSPVVCIGGKWGKITPDGFEEIPDYIPLDVGDPYGLLDGSWNDYSNDYIQAEIISRANYNQKPDTEADRIIKDLLYLCAWYKLEKECRSPLLIIYIYSHWIIIYSVITTLADKLAHAHFPVSCGLLKNLFICFTYM